MAMAALSGRCFTGVAGFPSTGQIIPSLTASPNYDKKSMFGHPFNTRSTVFGGNRAAMSVNLKPKTSSSPWLMLPPTFDSSKNMVYQFYSLADDKVVSHNKTKRSGGEEEEIPDDKSAIVGSSHGWLALFNRKNLDLFLSNPISGRHIKLPPIHNLDIPQVNLDGGYGCVNNVIISSSDPENDDDCRAMIAYGPADELAFCCPSRRSTDWSLLGDSSSFHYNWLAYSSKQNLFLCGCHLSIGDIEAWDLRDPLSPTMTPIAKTPRMKFYRNKKELELKRLCGLLFRFLVVKESSDEIFHVKQYVLHRVGPDGSFVDHVLYGPRGGYGEGVSYKTVGFDVHKYDPETGSLVYMNGDLGGLALFVGPIDGGFALSPDESPELKPNSIYYTDSAALPEYCEQPYGGFDVGIFDYENSTFSSCYYPCDLKSILTKIQPIPRWFTLSG